MLYKHFIIDEKENMIEKAYITVYSAIKLKKISKRMYVDSLQSTDTPNKY